MQGDYTILWLAQIRKYDWLVYANIVKSLPVSKGISPQTNIMKNYKIQVMAIRGMAQIMLSEETIQSEKYPEALEIGRIRGFEPLDKDTRLEVWISSEESEVSQ